MIGARVVGALALAAGLLAAAAARADVPAPARLGYEVYFGGLQALALQVDVDLSDARYRVALSAHTEGVIDWLFGWTAQARSEGQVTEGAVRPLRHGAEAQWHGNRRTVALTFHDDGTIAAAVEPSAEDDEREPVTAAQTAGALDPISAVLLAMRSLAAHGSCAQRLKVFDGRRRFDLVFSDGGKADLKPTEYGSFSGAATVCLFEYVRVAGFQKPGGRWGNPRDEARVYRAWLAPVLPGLPPVPVRIEVEGTFGSLVVHLVDARAPPRD
jgi:hypothetical protein